MLQFPHNISGNKTLSISSLGMPGRLSSIAQQLAPTRYQVLSSNTNTIDNFFQRRYELSETFLYFNCFLLAFGNRS